ncbi:hypothetical protein [Nonomuraea sp. NPDC003709]|uniref:hypothetical protein n=1 Tax=Nonomuraea sp. NPDC003709 TaxID=3154450 RepID=UPI0033A00503
MTIYSQHPNRGKVQILATYKGSAGATSSTVTSLAEAALAAPIVDALNRISAFATVPVSVHDTRDGGFDHYPSKHLEALADRSARADLLNGAHSLWYEHVKLLLHQALTDLDDAIAAVPAPVRTAIHAELEREAFELRGALADYSEAISPPETESPRYWDFGYPFVIYDGGTPDLCKASREFMDRREEGITTDQRERAVADLRLLVTSYAQRQGSQAELEPADFTIFDEPFGSDGYYLTVKAPQPGDDDADVWSVEISRWEPDDPEDEECSSATGRILLSCACSAPPTAADIADLLNRNAQNPGQLAGWVETPVGAVLAGTRFVVTERDIS